MKLPKLRCAKCKAIDSMTKPYGKSYPCSFHKNCNGERKLKCKFCNNKYSEEFDQE